MPSRTIHTCLLAAAMTAVLLPTGCKVVNQAPAPADNETVVYQKWEAETHRPHVELEQRNKNEQGEYAEWRRQHPDHH